MRRRQALDKGLARRELALPMPALGMALAIGTPHEVVRGVQNFGGLR